jgi:hypothetical protein
MRGVVQLAAFLLALTICCRCNAQGEERTADEFIATYKVAPPSIQETSDYILAAADAGFSYYSVKSKVKLYCRPADPAVRLANPALAGAQDFDILTKEVASSPNLGKQPWVLALLEALQKTFTCS